MALLSVYKQQTAERVRQRKEAAAAGAAEHSQRTIAGAMGIMGAAQQQTAAKVSKAKAAVAGLIREYNKLQRRVQLTGESQGNLNRRIELLDTIIRSKAIRGTKRYGDALKRLKEQHLALSTTSGGGFGTWAWAKQRAAWFIQLRLYWGAYQQIGNVIKTVIDFEKQLHRALRTANSELMSGTKIAEEYSKAMQAAVVTHGVDYEDTGEALYQLGSAGLSAEESLAALDNVMKLVVGTEGDVRDVTKAVAGIFNNYTDTLGENLTLQEKFYKITNVMATAWRSHQIEISELVNGYKMLASTGISAGLSLIDVTGILATLNDHLIKGGRAGRSLRTVISKMARAPYKFADAFGLTGDVAKKFTTGEFDFLEVMQTVHDNMKSGKTTTLELAAAFKRMGLRGTDTFLTLAKYINEARKNIRGMESDVDNLTDIEEEMLDTLSSRWSQFGNVVKNSFVDALSPISKLTKEILAGIVERHTSYKNITYSILQDIEMTVNGIRRLTSRLGDDPIDVFKRVSTGPNVTEVNKTLDNIRIRLEVIRRNYEKMGKATEVVSDEEFIRLHRYLEVLKQYIALRSRIERGLGRTVVDTSREALSIVKERLAYEADSLSLNKKLGYEKKQLAKAEKEFKIAIKDVEDAEKNIITLQKESQTTGNIKEINEALKAREANEAAASKLSKERAKWGKKIEGTEKEITQEINDQLKIASTFNNVLRKRAELINQYQQKAVDQRGEFQRAEMKRGVADKTASYGRVLEYAQAGIEGIRRRGGGALSESRQQQLAIEGMKAQQTQLKNNISTYKLAGEEAERLLGIYGDEKYLNDVNSYDKKIKDLTVSLFILNEQLADQSAELAKTPWDKFVDGIQQANTKFTDFKTYMEEVGQQMTGTVQTGLTSFVGSTLFLDEDAINSVKSKMSELNNELNEFKQKKAELTSGRTFFTEEEADEINELNKSIAETNAQLENERQNFDDLADPIERAKNAFKDFADTVVDEIKKMIAKMIVMYIWGRLMSWWSGLGTSSGGASVGSYGGQAQAPVMRTAATGGVFPNFKGIRKLAKGGITSGPAMAIIGENSSGRELVIPSENIKKDSVSGYTRDSESSGGDIVIANIVDKDMMLGALAGAQGKQIVVNHINYDIINRGPSYSIVKGVR